MEANELRIGNYIKDVVFRRVHTVMEILFIEDRGSEKDRDHLDGISKINRADQSFYNGIRLTEEWLVKFNFKILKTGYYTKNYLHCQCYNEGEVKVLLDQGYNAPESLDHIVYVHQLQNLVFALTGEELKVSE